MAKKIKTIGPFKLDTEGAKKIGKSFILTITSLAVVAVGDLFGVIDFGQFQNLSLIMVPFILNALKKLIGTYQTKK